MRVRIYPYNAGSRSAKLLSETTGFLRLKTEGSLFRPRSDDVIINWGSTSCPSFSPAKVLNKRESIINAANKLTTFRTLSDAGVRIPRYSTSREGLRGSRKTVARLVLNGHGGDGIHISENPSELPDAPLYVEYIYKKDEFRVHVVGGRVEFIQRKARKLEVEDPNWEVRNLQGGFVFTHYSDGESANENGLARISLSAVVALGLDFGAVDVVQDREGELFVLEVNTACGLEQRTADYYKLGFERMISDENSLRLGR